MLLCMVLLLAGTANGQVTCDPNTPVFDVDLSGQPSGVWLSSSVIREGYCCTANGNDVCIRFNLLLDSAANGINFSVASGAVPGGALFYQINCGPLQMVGVPICLDGPGPHIITFCKPGNNQNTYQITSLPKPYTYPPSLVTQTCQGSISVAGLGEPTVQWTSIPPNATGIYKMEFEKTGKLTLVR
jgi:hypothetical protein